MYGIVFPPLCFDKWDSTVLSWLVVVVFKFFFRNRLRGYSLALLDPVAVHHFFPWYLGFILLCCYFVTKLGVPQITDRCTSMQTSLSSVQFSSVAQSCPTLCDPMNHSTPGLPVHHQLPEFTQTHLHWVSDAIQPSHPLSSPSPPAPNPSQHQGLFQWVNSSYDMAKVLEFQL